MSFGSVTNDYKQHIWGAAAYGSQQAAMAGVQEKSADFKNVLEETEQEDIIKSFGFGSQNSDGSLGGGLSAMLGQADDMLSQLQFVFMKNNAAATGNSVSSRLNAVGF